MVLTTKSGRSAK